MTRGFIDDCAGWAKALNFVAGDVDEEIVRDEDRDIQTFRIRFASGKSVTALTSMPRAWRSKGRPGDVDTVDEAAHVDDLETILEAVYAMLMWGGRIRVISTHYGHGDFHALVKDIGEGDKPGSLHTITLKDAIADGVFRRICEVTGQTWSPDAEAEWEASVRAFYGSKASQELDCVPSEGSGHWLSWKLIRAAEHLDAGIPEKYSGGFVFLGEDIARRRHMWCLSAFELIGDVLWLREMRTETNIPFSRMHAIRAEMIAKYRALRASLDQTGMGESVVETAPDGTPWAELSEVTKRRKKHHPDRIGTESGDLSGSIGMNSGRDFVEVGSPLLYANTFHHGAKKGEFGSYPTGLPGRDFDVPIPWGDIPARPFVGASPDDVDEINHIVRDFIVQEWVG